MHGSDGAGMLICIAAEILLVAAICLGGRQNVPPDADDSSAAETTVTTTVSESGTAASLTTAATTTTTAAETTVTTATTVTVTTTAETTASETTTTTLPRVLSDVTLSDHCTGYAFPEDAETLLGDTVLIGDSITLGFKTYGFMPADHVLARGGCGVRNVLEQEYLVEGRRCDLLTALEMLHPKYVTFAFGMNDLHMSSTEQYCENYRTVLTAVRKVLPHAQLCAISTTPVLAGIDFTNNATVDKYNAALRAFAEESGLCTYIDITPELKTDWNSLQQDYQSGDGIHLTPKGYAPYLWQVCNVLHEIAENPPEIIPAETTDVPAETTEPQTGT